MKYLSKLAVLFVLSMGCLIAEGPYPVVINDKTGYIDSDGNIVIKPQLDTDYEIIEIETRNGIFRTVEFPKNAWFSNGRAVTRIPDLKIWIFVLGWDNIMIDTEGNQVFGPTDSYIAPYSDGVTQFKIGMTNSGYVYDEYYTYLDTNGKIQFQTREFPKKGEEEIEYFVDYNVFVGFYISFKKISPELDPAVFFKSFPYGGPFSEGRAVALMSDKFGYIDSEGNWAISNKYEDARNFSDGLAAVLEEFAVSDKQEWKFIDTEGKVVIDKVDGYPFDFNSGLARVIRNGIYGFIDKSGNVAIPFNYERAGDFSGGFARVLVEGKYGYLDTKGNLAIQNKYLDAGDFSSGLAPVFFSGSWGYIDTTGDLAIMPRFDYAEEFRGEIAKVWIEGNMAYVNKKGEVIFRFNLD
jgi:hypothetical protein